MGDVIISRIFADFLEELKRLGVALTIEQEIALEEVHKNERTNMPGGKPWLKTNTSTLS